jgi:hypothetical protein
VTRASKKAARQGWEGVQHAMKGSSRRDWDRDLEGLGVEAAPMTDLREGVE